MSICVYCSAAFIKVVDGAQSGNKLRVSSFEAYPVPEGVIINGVITDEEAMVALLKEMKQSNVLPQKPISLVVDSSNIMMRTLNAPLLSPKEISRFVFNELSMYQEEETDMLYDYTVLEPRLPSGGASVLGVAASRQLIDSYQRLFRAAGFTLKSINLGINCQIKLARFLKLLKDEAYILAQVDGNNLVLSLYDGENFLLANRYRLLFGFGTDGWYGEFGDHLSSMIQFNKGQKSNREISTVFADGLSEEGLASLASMLLGFGIRISPLPQDRVELVGKAAQQGGFQIGKYQYNIGNLLKK